MTSPADNDISVEQLVSDLADTLGYHVNDVLQLLATRVLAYNKHSTCFFFGGTESGLDEASNQHWTLSFQVFPDTIVTGLLDVIEHGWGAVTVRPDHVMLKCGTGEDDIERIYDVCVHFDVPVRSLRIAKNVLHQFLLDNAIDVPAKWHSQPNASIGPQLSAPATLRSAGAPTESMRPRRETPPETSCTHVFKQSGEKTWEIGPVGGTQHFAHLKGFFYIQFLLRYPNTLALTLAPIRVNSISPGLIDTPAIRSDSGGDDDANMEVFQEVIKSQAVQRIGRADEVAQGVIYLATNHFITGTTLFIDGGLANA